MLSDAASSSAAESGGVLRSLAVSLLGPAGSAQAFSSATESGKVVNHWCAFQWLFFRLVAHWLPIERFLPLISNTRGIESTPALILACGPTCAFLSHCADISNFPRLLLCAGLLLASLTGFLVCIHQMCAALSLSLCSHFAYSLRTQLGLPLRLLFAGSGFSACHARLFVCLALAPGFSFRFAWIGR